MIVISRIRLRFHEGEQWKYALGLDLADPGFDAISRVRGRAARSRSGPLYNPDFWPDHTGQGCVTCALNIKIGEHRNREEEDCLFRSTPPPSSERNVVRSVIALANLT